MYLYNDIFKILQKDDDADIDFVWDDTALIKAYDKAINLAKEEVVKRIGIDVPSSVPKSKPQQQKQSRKQKKVLMTIK